MDVRELDVSITTRGEVPETAREYAIDKVTQLARYTNKPILFAEVKLALAIQRGPAAARGGRGDARRERQPGPRPCGRRPPRGGRRPAREPAEEEPGPRQPPQPHRRPRGPRRRVAPRRPARPTRPEYFDRPVDDREVVRHKTFGLEHDGVGGRRARPRPARPRLLPVHRAGLGRASAWCTATTEEPSWSFPATERARATLDGVDGRGGRRGRPRARPSTRPRSASTWATSPSSSSSTPAPVGATWCTAATTVTTVSSHPTERMGAWPRSWWGWTDPRARGPRCGGRTARRSYGATPSWWSPSGSSRC